MVSKNAASEHTGGDNRDLAFHFLALRETDPCGCGIRVEVRGFRIPSSCFLFSGHWTYLILDAF